MNVLFITDEDIDPSRGGVKRTLHILTRQLMSRYRFRCCLAYIHAYPGGETSDFHARIRLAEQDAGARLEEFIIGNAIDVVVLQKILPGKYGILPVLKRAAGRGLCKSIFVLHFSPEYLRRDLAVENIVNNIRYVGSWTNRAVNAIKLATYPGYRAAKRFLIGRGYRDIYRTFDRVVLLSERYVPAYARFAGLAEHHKLAAIGNPLSFDATATREDISAKKREVLIVARFDEKQKKLSRALAIWQEIERHEEFRDWKLVIVGFGSWGGRYRKRAAELRLNSVSFEGGPRDPLPYYRRASIFMMTSAYEGFPMALLESQQQGVVPVAFDTFASLHDIVEDGVNGLVIPPDDLGAYARCLMGLMADRNRREAMALNGVQSCRKYSVNVIAKQWVDLFEAVLSEGRPAR